MIYNTTPKILEEMSSFFKVFGDGTRLKIINLLLGGERNVCDISESLNMSQSSISHQLSYLRKSGLVNVRRDGKVSFYSLSDDHISAVFGNGFEHITEEGKI